MYFAICLFAILTPTSLAIYGGTQVDYNTDAQFFVSVRYNDKPMCSGVTYKDGTVLTSAYCVYVNQQNLSVQYMVGGTLTSKPVDSITLHPNFNIKTFEHDIAKLTVSGIEAILYFDFECPAPNPPSTPPEIFGIGIDHIGGALKALPHKRQIGEVPIDECRKSYQNLRQITDKMSCYSQAICSGDQGGPVVITDEIDKPNGNQGEKVKRTILHGIASWAWGCGEPGYPSVFTNICEYDTFLK